MPYLTLFAMLFAKAFSLHSTKKVGEKISTNESKNIRRRTKPVL